MQRKRVRGVALRAVLMWVAVLSTVGCKREASDEDRIRALFNDAAEAAEARHPHDAVAILSDRFIGQGDATDKEGARKLIAFGVLRGAWARVLVAGSNVAVDGDRAKATVDLVGARSGTGKALADLLPTDANAWRLACTLEREPKGWRVVRARWRELPFAEALQGSPPIDDK